MVKMAEENFDQIEKEILILKQIGINDEEIDYLLSLKNYKLSSS